jgi:hypothetical protein
VEIPTLETLQQLEFLVRQTPDLHVRYSEGWEKDRGGGSMDTESGIELPGLSVNPLTPESWWSRPLSDWLARQLCQYKHLGEKNPQRVAWIARGTCIGRGPDCEPLLIQAEPVALLSPGLLTEAEHRYKERFDAGHGAED